MRILIICGKLWPQASNNTNILKKLLPLLSAGHQIRLLSAAAPGETPPDTIDGFPVTWARDDRQDLCRRILIPTVARIVDRGGFSDALQAMVLLRRAVALKQEFPYDAVL